MLFLYSLNALLAVSAILVAPEVKLVEVPPRTAGKEALVVGNDLKALGTVYYTVPGLNQPGKAFRFNSVYDGKQIEGSTDNVVGFIVAGPADNPAKLAHGAWRIGVENVETMDAKLNAKLKGKELLNTEKNPDITFGLYGVADVKKVSALADLVTYTGRLRGEITICGITKDVSIDDATLIVVPANPGAPIPGDKIAIRFKCDIKLSDYGLKDVTQIIHVSQWLFFSTVPPAAPPPVPVNGAKDEKKLAPNKPEAEEKQNADDAAK